MQPISTLLRKNSFANECSFPNHIKVYFTPLKKFLRKNITKDLEKYTSNVLSNDGSLFLWELFRTRFPEMKLARRVVNVKLQIYLNSSTFVIGCDCREDCDIVKMMNQGKKDLRCWLMNFTDVDFRLVEKLVQKYDMECQYADSMTGDDRGFVQGINIETKTSTPIRSNSIFSRVSRIKNRCCIFNVFENFKNMLRAFAPRTVKKLKLHERQKKILIY